MHNFSKATPRLRANGQNCPNGPIPGIAREPTGVRQGAIEVLKARSSPSEENTHFLKRHKHGNFNFWQPTSCKRKPKLISQTSLLRQRRRCEYSKMAHNFWRIMIGPALGRQPKYCLASYEKLRFLQSIDTPSIPQSDQCGRCRDRHGGTEPALRRRAARLVIPQNDRYSIGLSFNC